MTTPYGSGEPRFDVCKLALAAGATHVERWTTMQPLQCKQAMERALQHKGFSLIEIVSQCPTHYGRYALKSGDPMKVAEYIQSVTYPQSKGAQMTDEEKEGKLALGNFLCVDKPIYAGTNMPL